jgi:hypothetical protein
VNRNRASSGSILTLPDAAVSRSAVTSDAGLLAYRELDDALGLTALADEMVADARTGKNGRHALVGLLRQSVFGRLAGYEDVNAASRRGWLATEVNLSERDFSLRAATGKAGISEATYYNWRRSLSLDKEMLWDVIRRKL